MECNRDEAAKAKELAEKKFVAKDIMGAKKFALKAQSLFPGLEGISQMLTTLDVYISAEKKFNGEIDFYGLLGLDSRADEETVRKQYRKLALVLHPDKNKSIGAEGAFKLISEAWSLLSDKSRRAAYDQKRNVKAYKNISNPSGGSSAHPGAFDFYNFTNYTTLNERVQKSKKRYPHPSAPASSPKQKSSTFWTACHRCKIQYEYLRVYLNHNLLCPNCHEAFFAIETPPPSSNGSNSSNFTQHKGNSNHQTAGDVRMKKGWNNTSTTNVGMGRSNDLGTHNENDFQWVSFSRTPNTSTVAQAANMVQQAYAKVKREREEAQAATKREEALRRKQNTSNKSGAASSSKHSGVTKRKRSLDDISTINRGRSITSQMGLGNAAGNFSGLAETNAESSRINENIKPVLRASFTNEIQALLVEKARKEIRRELNKLSAANLFTRSHEERIRIEVANEYADKSLKKCIIIDQSTSTESFDGKNKGSDDKSSLGNDGANMAALLLGTMSIPVPDPDFHDFDRNRTERDFEKNQLWAAYDDQDGMPRYYAMIHNVISSNPFKIRISWLSSKANIELGPLNWVGSGFSKTCGAFRIGKYEYYNSIGSFSHKVSWTKDKHGAICIYPNKGEVWALYKNWSPDWNELSPDYLVQKYEMVEVLEDYDDKLGITVIPLIKVANFKAVFHPHLDSKEIRKIPREEMLRFSHRVPSYLIRGHKAPSFLQGCWELDPAGTPMELLEIIENCKEVEALMNVDVKAENTLDEIKIDSTEGINLIREER